MFSFIKNSCPSAKHAMLSFTLSGSVFLVSFFSASCLGFTSELWALTYWQSYTWKKSPNSRLIAPSGKPAYWGPALYFCLLNFILRYSLKGFTYDVAVRSAFLGSVFATGFYFATFDNVCHIFGLYAMAFSLFHFSEFMAVALSNPKTLTADSFILNHSVQYWVAAVSSWVEAAIEYYFFPNMKTAFWISHVGVVMCLAGEVVRKSAMFTAKTNFNHLVQTVKHPDHQLVTSGVYSLCRHPSYVGWFYWSIGTQIILLNPVCIVMYTIVTWWFFNERVFAEEMFLISFFGEQYLEYQKKVGTGLPLIRGYIPAVDGSW